MEAKLNLMPMQDGDVRKSHADVEDLIRDFDYAPKWNINDGIKNFIQWYVDYYKVTKILVRNCKQISKELTHLLIPNRIILLKYCSIVLIVQYNNLKTCFYRQTLKLIL